MLCVKGAELDIVVHGSESFRLVRVNRFEEPDDLKFLLKSAMAKWSHIHVMKMIPVFVVPLVVYWSTAVIALDRALLCCKIHLKTTRVSYASPLLIVPQ